MEKHKKFRSLEEQEASSSHLKRWVSYSENKWVDQSGRCYPKNIMRHPPHHFSGCRLKGRLCKKIAGVKSNYKNIFSNFSCITLNPNIFFPIWILIVLNHWIWETSRNKLKKKFCYQIFFYPFTVWKNCSKIWSNFLKNPYFSDLKNFAISLEFQKFSITRTIFSHSRS